jgi:HD-like signal output (HDOD) protein
MGRIEHIIDSVSQLVSPPDVAVRIRAVLEEPHSTVDTIAATVSQDPALAVCLLKVANSALFGASQRVDSLAQAVTVPGTEQTFHLSVALSVAHLFDGIPNTLISVRAFWHHSVLCAVCARLLAAGRFWRSRSARPRSMACHS